MQRKPIHSKQFIYFARPLAFVPNRLAIKSKFVDAHFYGDGRQGPVKRDEIYSISNDVTLECLRRNIPAWVANTDARIGTFGEESDNIEKCF